jgi:ubiquinone/menaquinone biosynthesis C-methylase UbiE
MSNPTADEVRDFWNTNPLCARIIPFPLGSREYFEYYDPLRESIESLEYSNRLHEYRDFRGKRVLDVGAGNGYVLSKYAQEGAEVYGIDITPTAIDLCRKRFAYRNLRGDFRVAEAERLPFQDATFDCVCSMGVLHHVPDTEKAVAEIFRMLKPGGRLIVMFYHRNSAQYRVKYALLSRMQGRPIQKLVNEFDGVGNPKGAVYSRRELAQLLGAFESVKMSVGYLTGDMVLPRGGRFVPNLLLRPFAGWCGWNLYAKAFKPLVKA